jgi:hypothetical protein
VEPGGIAAAGPGLTGRFRMGLARPGAHQAATGSGSKFDIATVIFEFYDDKCVGNIFLVTIGICFNSAVEMECGLNVFGPAAASIIRLGCGILDHDAHNGLLFCEQGNCEGIHYKVKEKPHRTDF